MEMLGTEQLERVSKALQFLPLAAFSTIHAFCLSMLTERPVEAGIDPHFDLNTEGNVIWAFDQAWMAFLLECAAGQHPFMRFALESGIDLGRAQSIARKWSENPDLVLYTEDVRGISDEDIESGFSAIASSARAMHEHIGLIESEKPSGRREKRLEFVRDLYTRVRSATTIESKRELLFSLEVYTEWSRRLDLFEQHTAACKQLCSRIQKDHADFLHLHIARFVAEFVRWFDRYKRNRSLLYFDDLLYITREMLRTSREVRDYFKQRYRYLFIDEAQDTDPLQTEIVFFLSEEDDGFAPRWSEVKLKPGKLFMVGDPKQSVYRFRRADIAMYEDAKDRVAAQNGKVVNLQRNFRSSPSIITFVNRHFENSFADQETQPQRKLQPRYTPLIAGAPNPSKLDKHIFAIVSPDTGRVQPGAEYFRLEGSKIVSFIKAITDGGGPRITDPRSGRKRAVQLNDIMILLRNMTDVAVYEQTLEQSDIPHYLVGGKTFFVTEDIRGLVFALRAVDDPTDTVALFGALKSPVFGFSDQDLFDYVAQGRRLSIFAGKDGQDNLVSAALCALEDLYSVREKLRPSGVLKEVFNISGLCHVVMPEPNGAQKAARYFRLLELVHEIEANRLLSFRSVVDSLEQVMNLDDPQLANVTIVRAAENAVKITTIHKAKGLEAPVVILANGKTRSRDPDADAYVLRDQGTIVIPYGKVGGFYSKDKDALRALEAERDRCEEERLRYVAATRARDMLVICVPSPEEGQNTFNGFFAPSLILNPLVENVRARELQTGARPRGRSIDLQQVFDGTRARQNERLERFRQVVSALESPFVSVHDMMKVDKGIFTTQHISRGKAYGNVVHRIMQHYVSSKAVDVSSMLDEWMEAEGVPRRYRDDLVRTFEALEQEPHVSEARSSTEKYCEWEFFLRREARILTGVIDLVYRNSGGHWTIVDYKTDDVSDPARKVVLDDLYGRQLQEYSRAFTGVTGQVVTGTVLLYTEEVVRQYRSGVDAAEGADQTPA
jgi:ATP-dependent helicase/nuclease subunit A